ncbi:MAG: hypothetical protein K6A23_12995 [Butyrivibrio sp.]|nr:hypothetical protein [Butyrivibrio sp.]
MKGSYFMKIFEIFDEEINLLIGTLLYYEKSKTFIIELKENLDEWTAPLLFTSFVKKEIYTIPRDISFLWVKERIIPSGRQNINSILSNHNLKTYDEMKFLELSEGRCSQDNMFIKRIDSLPKYIKKRNLQNLTDCIVLENNTLLCFFNDNTVRKIELAKLSPIEGIDKVTKNKKLFESCKLGTDGYYVTFNDSIDIPAHILHKSGVLIPLSHDDFISFVQKNVLDTSEVCIEIECTRQNLSYMVKQGQLKPVKENVRGNLYLKNDVVGNEW